MPGLVLVVALSVAAGLIAERALRPAPVLRNVILVSLDTLRADHLGLYGGTDVSTPNLDRLARDAIVFDQHINAAPTTLASHTALMTGTWPHRHGVPRNGFVVDEANRMLAEVLTGAGFRAAGFAGAAPLGDSTGFQQGFEHYDAVGPKRYERPGARVTERAMKWLDATPHGVDDPPLFLFLHYFDTHAPYAPPEPFRSEYAPDHAGLAELYAKPATGSIKHIQATRALNRRKDPERDKHNAVLRARYRAEVAHLDHLMGKLLKALRARDLLDSSLLVIGADHGEGMDGHADNWNHGYTVFDEVVRTPLLVRLPGGAHGGTRVARQVSNVDVFPTLLELLGLPAEDVDGESFAPALRGEALGPRGPIFAEATKPWHEIEPWPNAPLVRAIRTDEHKLMLFPRTRTVRLFDLERDPLEAQDLWSAAAGEPWAVSLRTQLEAWGASADPLPVFQIRDREVQEQLEALGYVEDP